jgi:hypothetical protein
MSELPDERTVLDLSEIIDTPVGGKKNVILDATVLTTFISCARLYDFRHNLHLQSMNGKSNSLETGSLVHCFLEYFYRNISHGVKRQDAIGFAFAAAQTYITGCKFCTGYIPTPQEPKPPCGHKVDEFPGLRNTPKDDEGYKIGWARVLETCQQYVDFWVNDHWVTLAVENVIGNILYEDDEIRILWKAKIDWLVDTNQGIYSTDHKTMKQKRDSVSLNHQFIGQCIVTQQRGMFINKIGFQKTLEPKEKFQRQMMSYSAARLAEWQSETLPFYAKLMIMYHETGHFPPNYDHCDSKYGHCAFKDVCESDPSMRESEIKRLFVVGPEWNPTNDEE